MVNKERVQLFVNALRSGEYLQGRGTLCRIEPDGDKKFCCLGVACEVAIANGLELEVKTSSDGYVSYDNLAAALPPEASEWYGFTGNDPRFSDGSRAVTRNDGSAWTFNQIADAFEQTYLKEDEVG